MKPTNAHRNCETLIMPLQNNCTKLILCEKFVCENTISKTYKPTYTNYTNIVITMLFKCCLQLFKIGVYRFEETHNGDEHLHGLWRTKIHTYFNIDLSTSTCVVYIYIHTVISWVYVQKYTKCLSSSQAKAYKPRPLLRQLLPYICVVHSSSLSLVFPFFILKILYLYSPFLISSLFFFFNFSKFQNVASFYMYIFIIMDIE